MKDTYKIGDQETYTRIVEEEDFAKFENGIVHEVYSTFALVRDAEWSGRLFVLGIKEEDEEGIGTGITVEHIAPAFLGDEVVFTSTLEGVEGTEVVTAYEARVGERIIARGVQKQRVLKKSKIESIFNNKREA